MRLVQKSMVWENSLPSDSLRKSSSCFYSIQSEPWRRPWGWTSKALNIFLLVPHMDYVLGENIVVYLCPLSKIFLLDSNCMILFKMLYVYPDLEIGHRFHSQALLPNGHLSSPAVYKDSGGITESISNSWYFIHMQIRLCSSICIFSRWDTVKFWPIDSYVCVYKFHKRCAWRLGIIVRNQSKLFNVCSIF